MNHPLNTVRYADLVGMLRITLKRINDYLDVSIELKKLELEKATKARIKKEEAEASG